MSDKAAKSGEQGCAVNFDQPPKDVKYGSLGKGAQDTTRGTLAPGSGNKRPSLAFPKNPPPKGIQFPFMEPSEEAERIVHTESHLHEGAGNVMGKIRVGHQKLIFPGWLIELDEAKLNTIIKIKTTLATGKKICDIMNELATPVRELGVTIPKQEIIEVLRRIPLDEEKGWSFPHFMLAMGSPKLAREKGALQDPIPFKSDDCNNSAQAQGDSRTSNYKNSGGKQKTKEQRTQALERLHQPYKYDKVDTWPLSDEQARALEELRAQEEVERSRSLRPKKESEEIDLTGYSLREKVFFSGLLIFEMYHTIRAVEDLYFQSDNIPVPKEKTILDQARRGFGIESAGTRKLGFAEWDRPLPPLPSASPYKGNLPFVATRWKITRPNEEERTRRRTLTTLQPLHLMVNPPPKMKGKIKVTENQGRIKRAIDYLASIGNCLAKLPFAHCIVHLSDTFLQKLEEINVHNLQGDPIPEVKPNNDLAKLQREVKELLYLYGLPRKIDKMKHLIDYNSAVCLRKICDHIKKQHWEFISEKKVEFRNKAWELMHVERIPCGPLRENFVYTFNTYLPYKSHLPVVSDTTPNPL
ncbi:uncharacterized protein LOC110845256 isoform X2 [Folsomia candida]|nr:uncharacterized protein LOC110845256 isoform X2 [Folsomia candida]